MLHIDVLFFKIFLRQKLKMPHGRDFETTPRMLVLHLENEIFYEFSYKFVELCYHWKNLMRLIREG